jgi:2,4-dienoyl-CoA reductase-like NADH-dependent reductase (Old Yellow Enzyme family)
VKRYPKIAQFQDRDSLLEHIDQLGIELPCDPHVLTAASGSPLAESWSFGGRSVGNRWCIQPMEGWDAGRDGSPSERTIRRWQNFGLSGAKLIWGGEAAAVRVDGRANPHQTLATLSNEQGLARLLTALQDAHRQQFGQLDDLVVGLQLTHSGRFCRPHDKKLQPRIAYHHPLLDEKFAIQPDDDAIVWSDEELEQLIDDYRDAALLAERVGFDFVDIKACHGYLLHEFLSARTRPGKFGGDLQGRSLLLRTIIERVQQACPGLLIGVRLSLFDTPPFVTSRSSGQPMDFAELLPYQYGFGVSPENPMEMDLAEPLELIGELIKVGVAAINLSCGSPYYNPHLMRPATFPPSDGYFPPEDPLIGVARQVRAARLCKQAYPECPMVGSGYSYLQDYLPQVAQAVSREGWIDSVGLGRMVLSYPQLPHDTLTTGELKRKQICRTFSDCTTAPRNGLESGCFPLDPFYKQHADAAQLRAIKKSLDG